MAHSFNTLLRDLAVQIGIDPDVLIRTQEVIVGDTVIGLYLDAASDDGTEPTQTVFGAEGDSRVLSSQLLVFFTLLGEVDQQAFPRVARTLLEANNLWAGTAGCTLGLQRGSDQVILAGQLPLYTLDGPSLSIVLYGFCDTADFWRAFVAGAEIDDIPSAAFFLTTMA